MKIWFSSISAEEKTFLSLLEKYRYTERYQHNTVKFLNYQFEVPDTLSFIWQFKDIFVDEVYRFKSAHVHPIIFDCGANVGTSCIYFRQLFPTAKIIAFEADPNVFKYLKNNLKNNNIENITCINKAVWNENGFINFNSEGADAGSTHPGSNPIQIQSIKLSDLIRKESNSIDFLKLDIEGAEVEVMMDIAPFLHLVDSIFIEYHSRPNNEQKLDYILSLLRQNGFRYYIFNHTKVDSPFINQNNRLPYDLLLNIHAYRP